MTREEAIEILWRYDVDFEPHPPEEVMHALDMAIEALSDEPTVIRSKTLMPTKDFKEWAKRIREVNPNAVVIPCDAEVVSAEAVQGEWKYVEKDGNPKEMGTYYCLVVAPSEYNGKTIPYYEYDTRWFGEGETAQAWKMDGQPDSGLVWTEQTGSMQGEQVYAWRELPDTSNCLVDPQAFERLCEVK